MKRRLKVFPQIASLAREKLSDGGSMLARPLVHERKIFVWQRNGDSGHVAILVWPVISSKDAVSARIFIGCESGVANPLFFVTMRAPQ